MLKVFCRCSGESELGVESGTLVSPVKTAATDTMNVELEIIDEHEEKEEETLDMDALEICNNHESNKNDKDKAKEFDIGDDTEVVGETKID